MAVIDLHQPPRHRKASSPIHTLPGSLAPTRPHLMENCGPKTTQENKINLHEQRLRWLGVDVVDFGGCWFALL